MAFPNLLLTRRNLLISAALMPLAMRRAAAQETPIENPALPDAAARDAEAWHHATALTGTPKYPEGFSRFDYVNADAPKTGRARLASMGSFDTFNPVPTKGEAATGLGLVFETLMVSSLDELNISAEYGLLAEAIRYPADFSWVSFRMNPKARWHDGKPVTADDVVWSFEKQVELNPQVRFYYRNVVKAEVSGDGEVTFLFNVRGNRELPHIMGQLMVLAKHWWEGTGADGKQRDVAQSTLEPPLGSGPYRIGKVDAGRSITFERVKDYWGADLPSNVGQNNFDEIAYEYYRDGAVIVEALKADAYDFRLENSAKNWVTAYEPSLFPGRAKGFVKLETFPDRASGSMQAFVPNLRRKKFQDWRVRRALNFAFDFETTNRTVLYDLYLRNDSYFAGTELASSGLPQGKELEILEKYRELVPETVFTEVYSNPVAGTDAKLRNNLREAVRLLREAGYAITDRKMVHTETGEPLTFEILDISGRNFDKIVLPYVDNLRKIGIDASYREIETSSYINRWRAFDYDMIISTWGQSLSPGNEQRNYWGSESKDREGSRNFAGIADDGIDRLIDEVIFAKDRDTLVAATRALDRALLHHNYVIPQWYYPYDRMIYWDRFGRPDPLPEYSNGFPTVWWWDADKAARIQKEG
ncbi:extracellular solute-binding protein [Zhengella mangrovi]|nr:extracellular solute-binding protein [Zhengella mangrovi]